MTAEISIQRECASFNAVETRRANYKLKKRLIKIKQLRIQNAAGDI